MTCVFFGANWRESGQKTAVWLAVVIRWLPMRASYMGATFGAVAVYWSPSRSLIASLVSPRRFTANEKMMALSPSKIGYRTPSGSISDAKLHDELMAGVDDTPLRIMSAQRAITQFGLTRAEAESVFDVKLPDGSESA